MQKIFFPTILFLLFLDSVNSETAEQTELRNAVLPQRSELQKLEQVERLFENGKDNEAAQLLGQLIENAGNTLFFPADTPPIPFRQYLLAKLKQLPKKAQDSYLFAYETTAKRLLENAVTAKDIPAIAAVAVKYAPTKAGHEALLLIAQYQYTIGGNEAALLNAKKSTATQAAALAEKIEKRIADLPKVPISTADYLDIAGWQLPNGTPGQNPDTAATAPLLESDWISGSFYEEVPNPFTLNGTNSFANIPTVQPIILDGKLLYRSQCEITAVDIATGKRLWTAAEEQYFVPGLLPYLPFWKQINAASGRAISSVLTHCDRISSQLSALGNLVFSVEEHELMVQPRNKREIFLNGKQCEDLRYSFGNTLTARNVGTGEIVWQTGKFPAVQQYLEECVESSVAKRERRDKQIHENHLKQAAPVLQEMEPPAKNAAVNVPDINTSFLGVPLPLQGKLYVIAEIDGIIQLLVLDPLTGKEIASMPLAVPQKPLEQDFLRRCGPLTVSAHGGIIVCPTGVGLTVALDATTLQIVWCFGYADAKNDTENDRMKQNQIQQLFYGHVPNAALYQQIFAGIGWLNPGIVIAGNRVVIAPPDKPALYCLDFLTGKKLWESKSAGLYVACIHGGKVFAATSEGMKIFDVETGKTLDTGAGVSDIAGIGVHAGSHYFLPSKKGLYIVDLEDISRKEQQIENWKLDAGNSNLVGVQGKIFAVSTAGAVCFAQKEALRKIADSQVPSVSAYQRGRLLKDSGKFREAVTAFRQSLKEQNIETASVETKAALRQCLLDAAKEQILNKEDTDELRILSELPEEKAEMIYTLAAQAPAGEYSIQIIKQGFELSVAEPVMVPIDADHSALLPIALGQLIQSGKLKIENGEFISTLKSSLSAPRYSISNLFVSLNAPNIPPQKIFDVMFHKNGELKIEGKELKVENSPVPAFLDWGSNVDLVETTQVNIPTTTPDKRENEIATRILRLATDKQLNMYNRRQVPVIHNGTQGSGNRMRFEMTSTNQGDDCLVGYDANNCECFQLVLGNSQMQNGVVNQQIQVYAVPLSSDKFLIVRGNGAIAIKIADNRQPSVLWKKYFSSMLLNRLNNMTTQAEMFAAQQQKRIAIDNSNGDSMFPVCSVFVQNRNTQSSDADIVCIRDGVTLYGLDPDTGLVLWKRKQFTAQEPAFISGDARHIFAVDGATKTAAAIDPVSGSVLAVGKIPTGAWMTVGTKIVFRQKINNEQLFVIGNLRDMFDRRKIALSASEDGSNLPVKPLKGEWKSIQTMQIHEQYLAVLEKNIMLHHLDTGENIVLDLGNEKREITNFYLENIGSANYPLFLTVLGHKTDNSGQTVEMIEDGVKFRRYYMPPNHNRSLPKHILNGTMMLFAPDGKRLWDKSVDLKHWYLLDEIPGSPVILLAAGIQDVTVNSQSAVFSTALMGVDKRTGKVLFRKLVPQLKLPNQGNIPLQNFRVESHPDLHELVFTSPQPPRTVKAVFKE